MCSLSLAPPYGVKPQRFSKKSTTTLLSNILFHIILITFRLSFYSYSFLLIPFCFPYFFLLVLCYHYHWVFAITYMIYIFVIIVNNCKVLYVFWIKIWLFLAFDLSYISCASYISYVSSKINVVAILITPCMYLGPNLKIKVSFDKQYTRRCIQGR